MGCRPSFQLSFKIYKAWMEKATDRVGVLGPVI